VGLPGVDGQAFSTVFEPASQADVAELLTSARSEGKAVTPTGGSTKLSLGNLPSRVDWAISMRKLDHVLAYEPTDLTVSVEAGITLQALHVELAKHGQTIPIEVPQPSRETIGGLIATALTGPRRLGSGTLRDLLIGISVAYADGTVGNAGGMVVKNVSGFDLMRMHHGALGTLGIVVSANFKVLPLARSETTLLKKLNLPAEAAKARETLARGRYRPLALQLMQRPGELQLAVRLEGRPGTMRILAHEVARDLQGADEILVDDDSKNYWARINAHGRFDQPQTPFVVQMRTKPADVFAAYEFVCDLTRQHGISVDRLDASLGTGTIEFRWRSTGFPRPSFTTLVGSLRIPGYRALVFSSPPWAKQEIDVWGFDPSTSEMMRLLKREFDPWSVLNPGRLIDETR
jgi:glycolate dehydrogenase FAD-binding subunit